MNDLSRDPPAGAQAAPPASPEVPARSPQPTRTDPRHRLGATGEDLAAAHLQRLGYRILARNYRTRWGELDLVAHRDGVLAFVEVKTRRASANAGSPFEAVGRRKQAQVRRMAAGWLAAGTNRPWSAELRFDVIGLTVDHEERLLALEHREGVF